MSLVPLDVMYSLNFLSELDDWLLSHLTLLVHSCIHSKINIKVVHILHKSL